ncbi:MAG: precorrin-6y C5,15-methyltransferase (decarboxylating) subunit CbiE [Cyanobacteriota bacterium]|nr:precorrin-6y C5,15-methyltransferase (decarboxylating) subunit CbiE [Cyanobacteriota bacterium]
MPILLHVIGIGLEGAAGLNETTRAIIEAATVLAGSDRHLNFFPRHSGKRIVLSDFTEGLQTIKTLWKQGETVVILVTGDPLFFGLGRLLLEEFPPDSLHFSPHLNCVQLAFNRLKVPWQDACWISAHGRSLEALTQALQQGKDKVAVLTDNTNTPNAIARLYLSLDLPVAYDFWVCENLGGTTENVRCFSGDRILGESFAPLNIVVLLKTEQSFVPSQLPIFGLPDSLFYSFRDRPGLMTKREVRIVILGELALQPNQVVWDIGAGTGSVSIEIARLLPNAQIYAIEKTAMGQNAIEKNCDRFGVNNVTIVRGTAPQSLTQLPAPDRVFIGGSGGNLRAVLQVCEQRLAPEGIVVAAFATLEHLNLCLEELRVKAAIEGRHRVWSYRLLQINLSRSVPVASLTRFSPLNPVTLVIASRTGD